MTFDKEKFLDDIKKGEVSKKSVVELYRMYKTYNLIKLVLEKNGKESVQKLEDSIYTVDNKILSDRERIILELSNITDKANNIKNSEDKEEINEMINKLKIELEELNLSDKTVLFYFKKNLSLLQIKLGIQNTFLLAAFELFLESYRNMCIKHIANKNYTLIKNSEYKYISRNSGNKQIEEKNKR